MAPIISGLDLIWRNNIDIIALTTDELQNKEKSDLPNEPNYYWNGLIPQTIVINSDGEVKYDQNGMINIDELNKVIGELKGIDIEDTSFSVESFNEYNSIISEKKDKPDRCLRIARQKMPKTSAYRSGLIVKCRKGMIWKKRK